MTSLDFCVNISSHLPSLMVCVSEIQAINTICLSEETIRCVYLILKSPVKEGRVVTL